VTALHAEFSDITHREHCDDTPLLVMAHGFTQTCRTWGEFADLVNEDRATLRVDLPGHGGSSSVVATFHEGADALVEAALNYPRLPAESPPNSFDLLGYSMGSRYSLRSAIDRPGNVRSLVLLGATGGIDDERARTARRVNDEALARELEASRDVSSFIDRWVSLPMFARVPAVASGVAERKSNTAAGLASSLRSAGTGVQPPLWSEMRRLQMPVLVVAGANDPRYVAHGVKIARLVPNATLSLVPGAGHACHLEQPSITASIVISWLRSLQLTR
jgi:2-succinyl-6-hydroxy-2,4-cyclohexadiene-1-carboxylate synthase